MKNNTKRLETLLAAATLVFGLSACGTITTENSDAAGAETIAQNDETQAADNVDTKDDAASGELETLELAIPGTDGNYSADLLNLAIANGYIEEELNEIGYTAHWNAFLSGPEINEAIAGGSVVGGELGDLPVFVSNGNGVETTIIATVNSTFQYGIVVTNPDIKEAKDFEGKKVLVTQGTVPHYFWENYVADNGIDASTIEIINSNDPTSLLSTGETDAFVTTLSGAYYYESLGLGTVVVDGSKIGGVTNTAVFEFDNSFLSEHEDVAVAINKALICAYEDAVADPNSFYESLATENQPVEVVKLGYEWNESLSQLNPEITDEILAGYDKFNTWLVDAQFIASPVDIDKLVDTSYYEKALSELGK